MVIGMLIICIKKWISRHPANPILQSNIISNQTRRIIYPAREEDVENAEHVEDIEIPTISRIVHVQPINLDVETIDIVEQVPNGRS